MKTKFIALTISLLSSVLVISQEQIQVFYQGYDADYKVFLFEDEHENTFEFSVVPESLKKEFELTTSKSEGKAFEISYDMTETVDEDGEEMEIFSIITMKPIMLERKHEDDEPENTDY